MSALNFLHKTTKRFWEWAFLCCSPVKCSHTPSMLRFSLHSLFSLNSLILSICSFYSAQKEPKKARPFVFSGGVCLCSLKCPHSRDRIGRHFRALAKTPALHPEKSDGQDWMQDITNLSGSSTCRSATPKNPMDILGRQSLSTSFTHICRVCCVFRS